MWKYIIFGKKQQSLTIHLLCWYLSAFAIALPVPLILRIWEETHGDTIRWQAERKLRAFNAYTQTEESLRYLKSCCITYMKICQVLSNLSNIYKIYTVCICCLCGSLLTELRASLNIQECLWIPPILNSNKKRNFTSFNLKYSLYTKPCSLSTFQSVICYKYPSVVVVLTPLSSSWRSLASSLARFSAPISAFVSSPRAS